MLNIVPYLIIIYFKIASITNDEHNHEYNHKDEIIMWYESIGPLDSKQENYKIDSHFYCFGPKKQLEHTHESLGEQILGYEPTFSGLDIQFLVEQPLVEYCDRSFSFDEINKIKNAITDNYYFKISIDEMPILVPLGTIMQNKQYIYLNTDIIIGYNNDKITEITIRRDNPMILLNDVKMSFSYSVKWHLSLVNFNNRLTYIEKSSIYNSKIHTLSIFNSLVMVIMLIISVLSILFRILKRDFIRYSELQSENTFLNEYGWKQVYADVFRRPVFFSILCSLVGCGIHLFFTVGFVLIVSCVFEVYKTKGLFLTTTIFIYTCLSPINGFIGGSIFKKYGGNRWVLQVFTSIFLIPVIVCSVSSFVNIFALIFGTLTHMETSALISLIFILIFGGIPLTFIGSIIGQNTIGKNGLPCRVSTVPRPIPKKTWLSYFATFYLFGGLLPFGSIFIEMYFVFSTIWTYKFVEFYNYITLAFFIMISITACISIVLTYMLLNNEDYRWHWSSFISGSSISLYIMAYSIYFYTNKSKMSGFYQILFYFCFSTVSSLLVGLMCGAVSYVASWLFVTKIYSTIKFD